MANAKFQLILTNYYFDGTDLKSPVKFKFQSSSIQSPTSGFNIKQTMFISQNTVQTDRSYFSLLDDTVTRRYLSAEKGSTEVTAYDGYKNTFEFTVHEKEKLQTVSSQNIFDMVGLAGGFNSILTLICGYILKYYNENMFFLKLFSKSYQVDIPNINDEETELSNDEEEKKSEAPDEDKKSAGIEEEDKKSEGIEEEDKNSAGIEEEDKKDEEIYVVSASQIELQTEQDQIRKTKTNSRLSKSKIQNEIVDEAMRSIKNRRMYNYNLIDSLSVLF